MINKTEEKKSIRKLLVFGSALMCALALTACTSNNRNTAVSPGVTSPGVSVTPDNENNASNTNTAETGVNETDGNGNNTTNTTEDGATNNANGEGAIISSDRTSVTVSKVKGIAEEQEDVENASVVMTEQNEILVALNLKSGATELSENSRTAIVEAAGNDGEIRITTDAAHYAEVKTLEAGSNGVAIARDKITSIWEAITR